MQLGDHNAHLCERPAKPEGGTKTRAIEVDIVRHNRSIVVCCLGLRKDFVCVCVPLWLLGDFQAVQPNYIARPCHHLHIHSLKALVQAVTTDMNMTYAACSEKGK